MINKYGFYMILLFIEITILIIYSIYVIVDERKRWLKREFFKYTIHYEIDYTLYFDMVKKMKIVLFKKKLELLYLNILICLKRLITWK